MDKKSIWIIVALVGSYVVCQAVADVAATKMVTMFGIVLPAGSIVFALTFTIRDLVHKRLGKEWARACIVMAGIFNIFQAFYLAWMAKMDYPPFFQFGEAWAAVFSIVPAITIASITAEIVSELIDTEVYHYWRNRFEKWPQWSRVVVSNAVSLPIDSAIFALLAFVVLPPLFGGEALPLSVAWSLVAGQIVWKAGVTLVSLPGIYLVKEESII